MPQIPEFRNHDASQDLFLGTEFGDDSMWSIQPDISGLTVEGTGKYTIYASNVSKNEAEMIPYRDLSNNVAIGTSIDSESFRYRYWGIKYEAGTSEGVLNIYLERKQDK